MKMSFLKLGSVSKVALIGTFLLSANYSWGVTAACNQTNPTTLSSLNTATGFNLYCIENDKTFSNFVVSGTGSNGGVTQTTSTVDIAGSSTFTSETLNTPWTVQEQFTGATAADFRATSNSNNTAITTGSMNYSASSAANTVNTGAGGYPTPQTGATNMITFVELSVAGSTGNSFLNGGDSMTIVETLCVGPCSVAAGAGNEFILTATFGNNDTTPSYTCTLGTNANAFRAGIVASTCSATGSGTPQNVQFAGDGVTGLNITDVYTLNANRIVTGGTNTTVTLTDFNNIFTEEELTPEPSTFVLLGSALAGIAALRLRKQKQS